MNLKDTIENYKHLTEVCAKTNYADKKSVKVHNQSVKMMNEIVNTLLEKFGGNGLMEFEKLLNVKENKTNVWVSVHLLEKLNPEKEAEKEALKIIREISKGNDKDALGFQYWLKNWEAKQK